MNNLKELNPVPTSTQGSSEDPPGFIYPSYRAAESVVQRDKRSLETSQQDVAHVSSAVGGSLSTLSFKETNRTSWSPPPSTRRGGGTRGPVRGFSRASRRNLLRRQASIDRNAFKSYRGRI